MRMITISIDRSRVDRLRRAYKVVEVFPGTEGCTPDTYREICIPDAHHRFADWAVEEGLGLESMFLQDDVLLPTGGDILDRMTAETYDETGKELIVFGQTEADGQVAPKAFTATPRIWEMIAGVWTGTGRIIPAWMPLVQEYGVVLNKARNIAD